MGGCTTDWVSLDPFRFNLCQSINLSWEFLLKKKQKECKIKTENFSLPPYAPRHPIPLLQEAEYYSFPGYHAGLLYK